MGRTRNSLLADLKKNRIRKDVLEAFGKWDQKKFFDPIFQERFYSEETVPVGEGEMSDPPGTLAKMLHYLAPRKSWRVMEIGTGSGYSTAVLSSLVREVVTVEFHESLALGAKERLARLRAKNIRFFAGEGTDLEELPGPFDAILVLAACQKRPLSLVKSLKEKGVMVFPMGPIHQQQIIILRNESPDDREVLFKVEYRELCSFTPLRGPYGWL